MTYGIEIRDAAGNLGTQTTKRISRIVYVGIGNVTIPDFECSPQDFQDGKCFIWGFSIFNSYQIAGQWNNSTKFLTNPNTSQIPFIYCGYY